MDNIRASQVSESSVTLNWDVPYTNNLKMYEIDVVNSKGDQHLNILTEKLTSQFRIQDLHDGTTYKYRVRAVGTDENKKGPWSEYNTFVTGIICLCPSSVAFGKKLFELGLAGPQKDSTDLDLNKSWKWAL